MRSKTIIPKIAVPIISRSKEEILADAECISSSCADAAEWRVDFYEDMNDHEKTVSLAHEIRRILNGKQFLFTCRTSAEGGEAEITSADYRELLFEAVAGRCADMIDAEIDTAKVFMKDLVSKAKSQGIAIVISHHNFKETPDRSRILNKFKEMNESGGDILKVAVMPNCRADVDRMIAVSREASGIYTQPLISIVMGEMGQCTRIAAEAMGSFLTFGSVGSVSAPGQIDAEQLSKMLVKVHENIGEFGAAEDSEKLMYLIEKNCL